MPSSSHLGRAVMRLCELRQTSAREIAKHARINATVLTRACSGSRLEAKSLRALCTSQPDPRDGLALLCAHLRDEIDRAGRDQTEITITVDIRPVPEDVRLLADECKRDPALRALVAQLAAFVRTHPAR